MRPCEICAILPSNPPEFSLYEGRFWTANLRDRDQTLLGTSFITARRHVSELDRLTPDEESEFIIIRNALFSAMRTTFQPHTFNTSCLKNDAFKADPDNTSAEAAHVHWHIKPRYGTRPITFSNETFQDPAPGRYLGNNFERHQPKLETALAIAAAIRSNIAI